MNCVGASFTTHNWHGSSYPPPWAQISRLESSLSEARYLYKELSLGLSVAMRSVYTNQVRVTGVTLDVELGFIILYARGSYTAKPVLGTLFRQFQCLRFPPVETGCEKGAPGQGGSREGACGPAGQGGGAGKKDDPRCRGEGGSVSVKSVDTSSLSPVLGQLFH